MTLSPHSERTEYATDTISPSESLVNAFPRPRESNMQINEARLQSSFFRELGILLQPLMSTVQLCRNRQNTVFMFIRHLVPVSFKLILTRPQLRLRHPPSSIILLLYVVN